MSNIRFTDDFELPQAVAGCMRIKDKNMQGEGLLRFVEECLDIGVTAFDHAPVYGGYECEKVFGDAVLRKQPDFRKKMKIITKGGIILPGAKDNQIIYYDSRKEELLTELDRSLERLGTDYVDLFLVHRPDVLADLAETAEALETMVKEGKALHVGVSNFTPSQLTALQSYMTIPLITNQVELSVKNVENFFNGTVDDALTRRMPLMAWSPLGGGSVFGGTDEQSERIRNVLGGLAKRHDTTIDVIMYAWLYSHPARIIAITGSTDIERIKAAVRGQEIILSHEEWYQILAASRGYNVP